MAIATDSGESITITSSEIEYKKESEAKGKDSHSVSIGHISLPKTHPNCSLTSLIANVRCYKAEMRRSLLKLHLLACYTRHGLDRWVCTLNGPWIRFSGSDQLMRINWNSSGKGRREKASHPLNIWKWLDFHVHSSTPTWMAHTRLANTTPLYPGITRLIMEQDTGKKKKFGLHFPNEFIKKGVVRRASTEFEDLRVTFG